MLPYFNYQIRSNYSVPQCCNLNNGFRVVSASKDPTDTSTHGAPNGVTLYDPILTYGIIKKPHVPPFRPKYVLNDNIVLTFNGYFREHIVEPSRSYDRIRYVNVIYFMEDDTITVVEPPVINSGFAQGRIIRRSRILKNVEKNEYYSWKDLNLGVDLNLFGIRFHLMECDSFTKEFLKANGVEINELEPKPEHRVPPEARSARIPASARLGGDERVKPVRKTGEGVVLSFYCIRIDEKKTLSDSVTYLLNYYTEDGTINISETEYNQRDLDSHPLLLKRSRVTKHSRHFHANSQIFPRIETDSNATESSVVEYIGTDDLKVGQEVSINGHRFLIFDCDAQTRKYYAEDLKMPQGEKVNLEKTKITKQKLEVPEYLGFGSPEDSLQSVFNLRPKPPRKDIKQYLLNANKYLRFSCALDTAHPEDSNRSFILKYSLADGKISIAERPQSSAGSAKFLAPQLVVKPGSDPKLPVYYKANDLYIGAVLTIICFRFKIDNADAAVYTYMQENQEMFSPEVIESMRKNLSVGGDVQSNETITNVSFASE